MHRQTLVILLGIAFVGVFALTASVDVALAQEGHFIEQGASAPVCIDIGTQVRCTGKVAGVGGTTFEITVTAQTPPRPPLHPCACKLTLFPGQGGPNWMGCP